MATPTPVNRSSILANRVFGVLIESHSPLKEMKRKVAENKVASNRNSD